MPTNPFEGLFNKQGETPSQGGASSDPFSNLFSTTKKAKTTSSPKKKTNIFGLPETTISAAKPGYVAQEEYAPEGFLTKVAKILLPKKLEDYFGLNEKKPLSAGEKVRKQYESAYAYEDLQKLQKQIAEGGGKLPKQTAGEVITTGEPTKYIPFVSAIPDIVNAVQIYQSAKRVEKGEETIVDIYRLAKFRAENERDKTFGAQVASVLQEIPSFAGELLATGGIFTGVKAGVKKTALKAAPKLAATKAGNLAIRGAGTAIGATVQTIPARSVKITEGTIRNMTPEFQLTKNELGTIKAEVTAPGEDLWKAATKSFANEWVEVVSEHSGGIFDEAAVPIKNQLMKLGIFKAFMKANPVAKTSDFMKYVKQAGWNGVLQEMGEERIGELLRGALTQVGLSDEGWKIPTAQQLAVELVSFSIPGAMIDAANKLSQGQNVFTPITEGRPTIINAENIIGARDLIAVSQGSSEADAPTIATLKSNLDDYLENVADTEIEITDNNDTPIARAQVVEYPDGKWGYSYFVDAAGSGITADFSSNKLVKTREEATAAAKKGIVDWATNQIKEAEGQDYNTLLEIVDNVNNAKVLPSPPSLANTRITDKSLMGIVESTIKSYREVGITLDERIKPNVAELIQLNELADYEQVIQKTQSDLKKAIDKGEIKKNKDGTITLWRAGVPLKENRLVSATYDRDYIDEFIERYGERPISEFKVKPEDIKYFIGGYEKEVLLPYSATGAKIEAEEKTQKEKVAEAIKEAPKTIKEIAEETKILEPNIRRILGVGAKKGTFERIEKGVYILNKDGKDIAYIHTGDAVEILPKLANEGLKADMVFLDIPYNTTAVRGGNRGVKYDLISVDQFKTIVKAVKEIARDENTPVFHMFSQAKSGLKEMEQYNRVLVDEGFKPVARGEYTKLQKDGLTQVRNMRGEVIVPEGIMLLTQSGNFDKENPDLNFKLIRPKGYQTEKPAEMIKALIEMGSEEGDVVLDPFAGSGVVPAEAVKAGRKAVAIEKRPEVVEEIIKPRVKEAVGKAKKYTITIMGRSGAEQSEVSGKPVDIGFGISAFAWRPDAQSNWSITEEKTGLMIADGRTLSAATQNAIDKINQVQAGGQKIGDIIELQLKRNKEVFEGKEKTTFNKSGVSGQADVGVFAEDTPVIFGNIDKIRPIETPEMIALVEEITGKVPTINKRLRRALGRFVSRATGEANIELRPDIFEDPAQVAKTLAHEIGHLIDWLPPMGIKRKSLLQKLYVLKNHLKDEFGGDFVQNKTIRDELYNLSVYWRPLGDNPSPGFLKYRKSGNELYADAISVLFNSPGLVEQKAPTFYKAFFASLDNKPAVNEKYWELQDLLHGAKDELFEARENRVKKGFAKGEDIQKEFNNKQDKKDNRLMERLRQQLDDRYYPILKKMREAEARGRLFDDSANPKYLLQEVSYVNNENYLLVDQLDREVSKPVKEAGMNDDDIGIYLLLDRIKNGRKDIANPYGFDVNTADAQLEYLKRRVGEVNFELLKDKVKLFHDIVFKSVEKAVEVGSYNKELYETTIAPNKENYATFGVVDYLQDYVPATVKKQVGTLKEVANPYYQTILKTAALNKLNTIQEAKNAVKDMLQKEFPGEIEKSKEIRSGGLSIFKPAKDRGQLQILEDGKLRSYDVDPYIARSFEYEDPDELNGMIKLLGIVNSQFKSLVTTYNLGFAVAFNPIRDFKRNYKNIPNANMFNLLKAYIQSLPSAARYAKGQLDDFTRQMVEDKLINAPMYDYNFDPREDGMGTLLEKYRVIKKDTPEKEIPAAMKEARRIILKPLIKLLEGIRFTANTFESVSKIAATKVRMEAGETGKELSYNIRNFSGTPNWKTKGTKTITTNEIFIFSNIMKEGLKSDFFIATNPTTRSGYWWKTAKIDLMPKFLMFLATLGVFGQGLRELFAKATEYDKTNYIIIPVGEANGKAVYFRIPHDETGRLLSSAFWKALNFFKDGDLKGVQDIASIGAGQLPSITPVITIINAWGQYLTGKNPYDAFRGRTLIDDTTYQAGGFPALKKMVQWTANTFGLSQFNVYNSDKNTTLENTVQILPLVNRFVKITDYGLTERDKEVSEEVRKERAREKLKEKDIINEAVQKYRKNYDEIDLEEVGDEVVKKILGHEPETDEEFARDKSIRGRLKTGMVVGVYDSRFDSLVYAQSNQEKVALLKKYKEDLTPEKYTELVETLYDESIISGTVYDEVQ